MSLKYQTYARCPNSPVVCTVLVLDRWIYCSGEQGPTAQHICKIAQSSLYNWTMLMNWKTRCCHLKWISSHKVAYYRESHSLSFNEAIWANIEKRMLGLALQSNSSNYPVLILHRQLGNYLFGARESYGLTAQLITRFYISQCLTLSNKLTTH